MKGRHSLVRSFTRLIALAGVSVAIAVACSGGEKLPPGMTGSGGSAGSVNPDAGGPCTDGQTRDCHVTLGQHNGVLSCYDGTQTCVGGTWGACGNGTVNNRAGTSGSGGATSHSQSLSSPTPCQNNPCDPYCQNFNEQPDSGITIPPDSGAPKYNWSGGTLTGLPTGLVNKGLRQPCATGADCQFNTYCQHPVTSQQCAHSKCQTGTGLDATCDPCVSDVCATDPSCCTQPYTTSCTHDPCTTGGPLKPNCDSCVNSICASDPYCCGESKFCFWFWCWHYGSWDKTCENQIGSICGKSCPLTKPGNWSQTCVNDVNTACDAKCGTGSPPPEDGTCVPWLPGQTDSSCSGVDLSAGVPCDLTIPVCNHGTQTAPSGIPIVSYPANSKQYPLCDPDYQSAMKTCYTKAPIPPGQCIDVTGCLSSTDNNREIMVNPPDAKLGVTGHVAECSCQDNWTLYTKGTTCSPPDCSGASSVATFKPVNLYFIVDKSGSMLGGKWTGTTDALKAFFQDPNSAGLGAALEFFPLSSGGAYGDGCGETCSSTPCANPMVPLGTLTAQPAPADTQEQALVTALGLVYPGGMTPTYPALAGALSWATNKQTANPNQQYDVVLVTDGVPTVCDTSTADLTTLADNAYLNNNVHTYTIAMDGADVTALDQIAKAGGTGSAFVVSGTNSNNVQQQMVAAFQSIAGKSASCTFPLPNTGQFDPSSATVTYTSGSGTTTTLPQEQSSTNCGAGWYYDNNTSPTQVTLCPQTCSLVQADAGAKVEVQLGCPKLYSPVTYTQTYQATCPSGTLPQWGYLAYDTTTPGDSTIVFSVRTAATQTGLSSASYVGAATAQASPDTQVCPISGPSPCPVDLYTKLGKYNAINQYMELQIVLNPTSNQLQSPTVNNWQITYSCPPAQ